MSLRHLILHIGSHKTATTSIQHRLWHRYEALAGQGILYPRSGNIWLGPHRLGWSLGLDAPARNPADKPEQIAEAMLREAGDKGCDTILLSAEDLSLLDIDQIERLKSLLPADQVTVVVYLRRQDDFLLSFYKQEVQSYFTVYPGDVLDYYLGQFDARMLDYAGLVTRWRRAYPQANLVVRIFEQARQHPGGMLGDFVETAKLPDLLLDGAETASHNQSLSNTGTLVLADFNNLHRIRANLRQQLFFKMLAFDRQWQDQSEMLGPRLRQSILARHADGNRQIATLTGHDPQQGPFPPLGQVPRRTQPDEYARLKAGYLRQFSLFMIQQGLSDSDD